MHSLIKLSLAVLLLGIGSVQAENEFKANEKWVLVENYNTKELVGPPMPVKNSVLPVFQLSQHYKTGQKVAFNQTSYEKDKRVCFHFQYYVNVPEKDSLKVVQYTLSTGASKELWARYGSQGDVWRKGYVVTEMKKDDQLNFEAETGAGTIAVGRIDYDMTSSACRFAELNADFEFESNWNGANPVIAGEHFKGQGYKDHTSGSAAGKVNYLYNGKISPKASLGLGAKCFTFWFMRPMPSDRKPTQPTEFSVSFDGQKVWKTYDERMPVNEWIYAQVPIKLINKEHKLEISTEMKTGVTRQGVYFDDIIFKEECDSEVNCDFRFGTCGWTHQTQSQNDLTWKFGNGRVEDPLVYGNANLTIDSYGAPSLFTDFTTAQPDYGIELRSPFLNSQSEHCATLRLSHNQLTKGDVFQFDHVYQSFSSFQKETLFTLDHNSKAEKNGNSGLVIVEIEIPKSIRSRRLSLFAKADNKLTRIVVDSVEIRPGRCKPLPTSEPGSFPKSYLDVSSLIIADDLMKNSRTSVERVVELIKRDDSIKDASLKVLSLITDALELIEKNLNSKK